MEQRLINQTLDRIRLALESGHVEEAITALTSLHPADQAEAFNELDEEDQAEVLPHLDAEDAADLFEQLDDEDAAEASSVLTPGHLADVLDEMEPDDAADVLGELTPERAATVIAQMEAEQKEDVSKLLEYDEDTAGGIMTPDVPFLRRQWTCQQAIDHLRQLHPDTESPYYLYVIDRFGKLIGVAGLRDIIIADPAKSVEEVMRRNVVSVPEGTDQEEVARLFRKYSLLAVPVVDNEGRLIGVIHNDDIVEVIEEEATEDLYRLNSVSSEGDLQVFSPVKLAVQRRLPWLFINLGTAFLAAFVISRFERTIALLPVLATLQSMVAGQGGNSGTQTLAMMVRGIAIGEVEFKDTWRAILREAGVGILHGAIIGICVGFGVYWWKGNPLIGLAIGLAMIGNMLAAGIAGTLVPITLKLLKLDPALASAVIVTAVTDSVGFGLFLGICTLLLPYLT